MRQLLTVFCAKIFKDEEFEKMKSGITLSIKINKSTGILINIVLIASVRIAIRRILSKNNDCWLIKSKRKKKIQTFGRVRM